MHDLAFASAQELAMRLRQRRVSATEVLEGYLVQITSHHTALHAIIPLDEEGARTRTKAAAAARAAGRTALDCRSACRWLADAGGRGPCWPLPHGSPK